MVSDRNGFASAWSKSSMAILAGVMLCLISTDRRPDDTSIQVALAAAAIGLFACIDLFLNRTWSHIESSHRDWLSPLLVAAFLAICTLSALWAGEPLRTVEVMALAWTLFLAWFTLRIWTGQQPTSKVESLLVWISLSFLAFALLLFSEVASNQAIHHYLVNEFGMEMSIPNYYIVTDTHITVVPQFLSQHAGSLSYLFWPILLAMTLCFGKLKYLFIFSFASLSAYSIFFSINETAMLGLSLGAVAFIAALALPRIAIIISAVSFGFVVLAIVPLTYLAHDYFQLQSSPYIPTSGQQRISIWLEVANFVGERLFFGHGVVHLQALLGNGLGFLGQHAHSHNFFLQTWYEVGLSGTAFILLVGLNFLKSLWNLPRMFVCFGVAGFSTVVVSLTTTAWEIWVPWHLGLLTLVAMVTTLIKRLTPSFDATYNYH